MKVRLTRIEAKRRGKSIVLDSPETRVGRDPESDLVIAGARVSRLHAMIRALGERHTLTDTESTNGTTVNGVRVGRSPVLLEPQDLIEFAGEAAYVYEAGPGPAQRWVLAAAIAIGILVAASGLAFWQRVIHDPARETANESANEFAREGREAADNGDLSAAHAHLREAARLLVRTGELNDAERSELMRVAMERLTDGLEDGTDYWALYQRAEAARGLPRAPQQDADLRQLDGAPDVETTGSTDPMSLLPGDAAEQQEDATGDRETPE